MKMIKIQRFWGTVLTTMLLPMVAAATPATLSIEEFSISAGETKTMLVDMNNPDTQVTLVQFDLRLPSGLSIAAEDSELLVDIAGRTTWKKHSLSTNVVNGATRFLLASNNNSIISGTSGAIISITLTAASNFNGGNIKLEKQLIVTPGAAETHPADYTFTVEGAPQDDVTLTAKSYSRAYGEANPAFEYTVTNGTITSGTPSITCSATATSPVGTYPIVISKGSVSNNTVNLVNGTLTITKASLTISAGNYNKNEGEDNPAFTPTFSGFKNNETNSVLTKQPTITTTATKTSPAGTYPVTVSGAEAQNYSITYQNGTLTVTAMPTNSITFADAKVKELCVANWDTDGDGELSVAEAAAVTNLGEVFRNNKNITTFNELKFFTGLTSIGYYAFSYCSRLTSITIPNSVTSIGYAAFHYCYGLTSITIPNSVTSIGDHAFSGCSGLTSVTIPNSVTSIGIAAISGCSGLTSITIPNSVTSIRDGAFSYCSGLTSITIPNSVTSIRDYAFSRCSSLTSVVVESGNTQYDSRNNCNAIIKKSDNRLILGCKNTVIPSNVTSIGIGAFCGCTGLTSITIPNSVTSIGSEAFIYCSGLTSITIPSSVTSIGSYAFYDCKGLTSIAISNSVTSIDHDAFSGCSGLTSVHVGWDAPLGIGEGVFSGSNYNNATLYVPKGSKSAYEAANVWKDFGIIVDIYENITFADAKVKELCVANWDTDGDGELSLAEAAAVTDLGTVFKFNDKITSFNEFQYFTGVTNLDRNSFQGCSALTSIIIPNSVPNIGCEAFRGCSSQTSISVDEGSNKYDSRDDCNAIIETASNTLIGGCKNTVIPNSVTSIGKGAFFGHQGLTSISIPSSVTKIDDYAFDGCLGLTSITIPNSVTSIGIEVFRDCSALTSIRVAEGNNKYDSRENCNAIIETASNTLISGCKRTVIPNSVTSIGRGAFFECTGLTSITIPNSVTSIGSEAFRYCKGLTSITIPSSVTSIGSNAFRDCKGLTSIAISNSVTSIDYNAFFGCSGLMSVHVGWDAPLGIGESIFSGSNYYNATLYVPKGTKALYETADVWKDFGNIVEMDETITIGDEGMGTYCSTNALDFSCTDDIKAYIVSAFKPSTGEVTLKRITDVPANTGIVVKGAAGTYTMTAGLGETIVSNMLKGVTTNTVLKKVEGNYTNYVLAKKNGNLGFYAVVDGSTLSAGKAYLPLPTASLPSGARSIKLVFDDGGTTGISEASPLNDKGEMINDKFYDLQGRRVEKPTRGLYIVNGRKVVIK